MKNIKHLIKQILPPFVTNALRSSLTYGFFGNFNNWNDAKKETTGYDAPAILDKVKEATGKVKNGKAAFERDSVAFDKLEPNWPILASLLLISSRNNNELNIVDFGGALGSTYFQHKNFLSHLKKLSWLVIEQKHFAECGKKEFTDAHLRFSDDSEIDHVMRDEKPMAILLGSSIQYLENPYNTLGSLLKYPTPYLIFDRTPFFKSEDSKERIAVQKVPKRIYEASYPAWILNCRNLKSFIKERGYTLLTESYQGEMLIDTKETVELRGLLFMKK